MNSTPPTEHENPDRSTVVGTPRSAWEHGQLSTSEAQVQAGGEGTGHRGQYQITGPRVTPRSRDGPLERPSSPVTHFNLGRIQLGWLLQRLWGDENIIEEP